MKRDLRVHDGIVGILILVSLSLAFMVEAAWIILAVGLALLMAGSLLTGFCPVCFSLNKKAPAGSVGKEDVRPGFSEEEKEFSQDKIDGVEAVSHMRESMRQKMVEDAKAEVKKIIENERKEKAEKKAAVEAAPKEETPVEKGGSSKEVPDEESLVTPAPEQAPSSEGVPKKKTGSDEQTDSSIKDDLKEEA